MKFGQKIFLITFAFVTVGINLIGISIINNNYKTQLDSRMNNNISNINNINRALKLYNNTNININTLKKDKTYYELAKEGEILYSNVLFDIEDIKMRIEPEENKIKSIIVENFLFMSAKTEEYSIILAENIEDILNIREEQIDFFIKASIIFSFVIAFCLYITISFATRRIKKLGKAVEKISKGDYKTRVKKLGGEEVGKLAVSFNKMADSVENNIEEIKRTAENRQNFINDISHEIRTPLTSIIGYSSLIKNEKVTDINIIKEYNQKINEEGNYLNSISERLMEIVLLDNKKLELHKVDLSLLLEEIIDNMEFDYERAKFYKKIKTNIEIESDKTLLKSLITNIMKNAIMAYKEWELKTIMIVLDEYIDDKTILKIIDQGSGMTEEQLSKVTEPFYTLNKDRNRKISGMGLGLPLCVKICEILNAEFKIESKLEEGTTVSIIFKSLKENN